MNEIIIRTNQNEYSCGSIIYGAVYVRIFKPISADSLDICVSGREICKWSRIVPSLGHLLLSSSSASKDSDGDDQVDDSSTESSERNEIRSKTIQFIGERILISSDFSIVKYTDGNVPLGCFAFPFKLLLKQGLPSSFRIRNTFDEIKISSYDAAVEYKITAMFRSTTQSNLKTTKQLSIRNEDFVLTKAEKCERQINALVSSCCCLPKGHVTLRVELDKTLYTLGETIKVKFWVENKSDVKIDLARIKLVRTVAMFGRQDTSEDEKLNTQIAFPFEVYNILTNLDSCNAARKHYEISLPLSCENEEILSSTLGQIVKCRYQLEVEVIVPWDADVSVFIPLKVYPEALKSWLEWKPPEWIKRVQVTDANIVCRVARHLLESSEFANVPLPLSGLN